MQPTFHAFLMNAECASVGPITSEYELALDVAPRSFNSDQYLLTL